MGEVDVQQVKGAVHNDPSGPSSVGIEAAEAVAPGDVGREVLQVPQERRRIALVSASAHDVGEGVQCEDHVTGCLEGFRIVGTDATDLTLEVDHGLYELTERSALLLPQGALVVLDGALTRFGQKGILQKCHAELFARLRETGVDRSALSAKQFDEAVVEVVQGIVGSDATALS